MPGASGRVLVVDDNKVIRQLIRVNLELEGLEVVTAADGAECLDLVHQVQPDVVTLDVVMPRLDGLRTAARLRADPRTRDLPLAIVSACTQYEVEAGLDVGIDAFLAKPFEPSELVRTVWELIGRRGRRVSAVPGGGSGAVGGAAGAGAGGTSGESVSGEPVLDSGPLKPGSLKPGPLDAGDSQEVHGAHGSRGTHDSQEGHESHEAPQAQQAGPVVGG